MLGPRQQRFAGVGIGLATAIKLVPGIFIVYLLVSRRWRAAAVASRHRAGRHALAAAVAPRDSWTFWTRSCCTPTGSGNLAYAFNQSLHGHAGPAGAPGPPSRWCGWRWPCRSPVRAVAGRPGGAAGDEVAGLTLAGFVGSLVSPVTWAHHLFWFVPALVVLVDAGLRRGRHALLVLALVVYVTTTVSLVAIYDSPLETPPAVWFLLSNWYVWVMLFLLPLLPIRTVNGPVWAAPPDAPDATAAAGSAPVGSS